MRPVQALFSAVQFLITALLICAGGFFLSLPWAPHMRFHLASLFSERDGLLTFIGCAFLGLGVLLLVGFYFMNRHVSYQLSMKHEKYKTDVDVALLRTMISVYWKEHFSEKALSIDVLLHSGKKMEVIVEIPEMTPDNQQGLMEKAEEEIGALLEKQLGYGEEFLFKVVGAFKSVQQ